jgi:hypothetical protein
MFLYLRRALLLCQVALLAACSGSMSSGTTPSAPMALTAPSDVDTVLDAAPGAGNGHLMMHKLAIRPDATAPGILMNFVSDGPAQGGVPCISCVNGAQTNDNVGLSGPSSYIFKGSTWQYSMSYTDISYKGKCKLAWAITAGKKIIDSFSATLNLTSSGGFVLYALNRNRPNFSGAALLTGRVTCGKSKPSTTAPLYFQ